MRKLTLVFLALFVTGMFSCQKEEMDSVKKSLDDLVQLDPQSGQIIEGQFVVVFDDNLKSSLDLTGLSYMSKLESVSAFAQKVLMDNGINEYELGNAYAEAIQGFSAKIGSKAVASLKKDSRVAYVLPDRMYIMRPPWETPDDPPAPEGQEVPYGIARVGYGDGTGKTAWIIDTGIDFEHEDLNVDASRGRNFIRTNKSADDDNGHGTHCAGTVAAIDNEIGVVGVAAGATVVPVKVLDRRGSGAYSVIIAGIDYVASAAAPGDAANMSLGGGVYQAIDDAVYNASQNGIYFSLAAGNESDDANYHSPARVNGPNIWTISAMDSNDDFAYFSNYGNPPVDFCEPGVSILSTNNKGGYESMSGTSMAAPHMCGILLMTNGNPKTDGYVNQDPDGNSDPIGHI